MTVTLPEALRSWMISIPRWQPIFADRVHYNLVPQYEGAGPDCPGIRDPYAWFTRSGSLRERCMDGIGTVTDWSVGQVFPPGSRILDSQSPPSIWMVTINTGAPTAGDASNLGGGSDTSGHQYALMQSAVTAQPFDNQPDTETFDVELYTLTPVQQQEVEQSIETWDSFRGWLGPVGSSLYVKSLFVADASDDYLYRGLGELDFERGGFEVVAFELTVMPDHRTLVNLT